MPIAWMKQGHLQYLQGSFDK